MANKQKNSPGGHLGGGQITDIDDVFIYPNTTIKPQIGQDHSQQAVELARAVSALSDADKRVYYHLTQHPEELPEVPEPELKPKRWTTAELLKAEFKPLNWIVPGILPVGLSILAGRPKIGKSWLALQIAHAVATGGRVFDRNVEQGQVLYIALEDNARRLQSRILLQNIPSSAGLEFALDWSDLGNGGLNELQIEISKGVYKLIVFDTLARGYGKRDQLDIAEMSETMGGLQELAISNDIAILGIEHHNKGAGRLYGRDPVDDILGSTGKSAPIDTAIGLYRNRGENTANLLADGRDLEETINLALEWDQITCCWQSLGDSETVTTEGNKEIVINAIRELAENGELPTTTTISEYTKITSANTSHILSDLIKSGKVEKLDKNGRLQPYGLKGLYTGDL